MHNRRSAAKLGRIQPRKAAVTCDLRFGSFISPEGIATVVPYTALVHTVRSFIAPGGIATWDAVVVAVVRHGSFIIPGGIAMRR